MIQSKTLLKNLRIESPLDQKDIATLVNMKPSNLVRYEHGHRNPTPELLLIYHLLFDAPLRDLLTPMYKYIVDTLVVRIKKLITELETYNTAKSEHKVHFLKEIVNRLSDTLSYES